MQVVTKWTEAAVAVIQHLDEFLGELDWNVLPVPARLNDQDRVHEAKLAQDGVKLSTGNPDVGVKDQGEDGDKDPVRRGFILSWYQSRLSALPNTHGTVRLIIFVPCYALPIPKTSR